TLGAATVTSAVYRDHESRLMLRDGEVRFAKAPLIHAASDDGDQPFHNVTIELLRPSSNVAPCAAPCIMSADQWTVSSVTLAPSARVDTRNALAVAVSDVNLTGDGPALRGAPGAFAMVHGSLVNAGATDARLVLLELK